MHIWPYTWSYATLYSTLHAMMCCHTNKSNLRPFSRPLLSTCIFSYFFGRFYLNFTFSFSPPYFSVILVFRCFWDIFFFFWFCSFLYSSTRKQRRTEFVDQRQKEKKKRKERKKHLNWTPQLPLCHFASSNYEFGPREILSPTLLCARTKTIRKKEAKM